MACDAHGAEEGAEEVFLLSVEVDAEGPHVFLRSELGLAVLGCEVVVVVGDVADEVDGPPLVGFEAEVGLVVEEVGLVLALGLERPEEILGGLVAYAVGPCKLLVGEAHVGAGPEERCRHVGLEPLGAPVGDVECRRHLVAILRREAA